MTEEDHWSSDPDFDEPTLAGLFDSYEDAFSWLARQLKANNVIWSLIVPCGGISPTSNLGTGVRRHESALILRDLVALVWDHPFERNDRRLSK
jgi:hypothetical protein